MQGFEKNEYIIHDIPCRVEKDSLLCYPCNKAYAQKRLFTNNFDTSFISEGFSNWKKATGKDGKIVKHENSACHQEAVEKFSEKVKNIDIGTFTSNEYQKNQEQNLKSLMIVIDYVRTMARQSIPFRNVNELESNFQQFLLAEGRRNASFGQWLQKKTYTSNLIQV